jgi:hypothetical protein
VNRFVVDGREFYREGRVLTLCGLYSAWYETIDDPQAIVQSLKRARCGVDIFTFFQRVPHVVPRFNYYREPYPVAVIKLTTYEEWLTKATSKNTRRAIKRGVRHGVEVRTVQLDETFIRGISEIYNETPVRQGRRFPHYGDSLEKIRRECSTLGDKNIYLGAYHEGELVGYARIVIEHEFADLLQLLSKISHREKCVSNALLARVVELCCARGMGYLAYGDLSSNTLSEFKRHNGFVKMELPRYYVPLTGLGAVALRFGLHRPLSSFLPHRATLILKDLRHRWHSFRTT